MRELFGSLAPLCGAHQPLSEIRRSALRFDLRLLAVNPSECIGPYPSSNIFWDDQALANVTGTGCSVETASGFDEAEVAIVTFVQHANAFGISIAKHKELLWIGRQIKGRLLGGHGLN